MNHIHSTNIVYKKNTQLKSKQKRCEESPVVCCGYGSLRSSQCVRICMHDCVCVRVCIK